MPGLIGWPRDFYESVGMPNANARWFGTKWEKWCAKAVRCDYYPSVLLDFLGFVHRLVSVVLLLLLLLLLLLGAAVGASINTHTPAVAVLLPLLFDGIHACFTAFCLRSACPLC